MRTPLGSKNFSDGIDSCFSCRRVKLTPGAVPMEGCADIDDHARLSLFHTSVENRLAHIKSSKSINFENFSDSIRRNLVRACQEITGGTVHQDIDLPELLNNILNNLLAGCNFRYISRLREARPELTQLLGHSFILLLVS